MQNRFIIAKHLLTAFMLMLPLMSPRAQQTVNTLGRPIPHEAATKPVRHLPARKNADTQQKSVKEISEKTKIAELDEIIVVGNRASLATAQEIKQRNIEIVDSVVANTINKLPDFNVSDAMQRITGVQITRDRGEGSVIQIRGLSQVETLLNGRELFTAGNGRNLDYADIPSELLAGIDVYKTPAPDLLEGGIGGTVNLRTHRPFDFQGREIVGSVRGVYGDLADAAEPQFSTLLSNRWQSEKWGEFGALFNFSYQQRAWREDQKATGNPVARGDLLADRIVIAPNGTSETTSLGHRERTTGSVVLQWQANDRLDLYAEANYTEFNTRQDSYQINVTPLSEAKAKELGVSAFAPGSVQLFDGGRDLKNITWTNASASVLSFARDTVDRTRQGAVGGSWNGDHVTLSSDLSYTESLNKLFFSGPFMSANVARFNQNLSGEIPGTGISGTDLLNPENFTYTGLALRTRPFAGDLKTARLDGEYFFNHSLIDSLGIGFRYA